jgi:hypothetical protein
MVDIAQRIKNWGGEAIRGNIVVEAVRLTFNENASFRLIKTAAASLAEMTSWVPKGVPPVSSLLIIYCSFHLKLVLYSYRSLTSENQGISGSNRIKIKAFGKTYYYYYYLLLH